MSGLVPPVAGAVAGVRNSSEVTIIENIPTTPFICFHCTLTANLLSERTSLRNGDIKVFTSDEIVSEEDKGN